MFWVFFWYFFFFKQKTAYEMRISDWSSDVCSSDLNHARAFMRAHHSNMVSLTRQHSEAGVGYFLLILPCGFDRLQATFLSGDHQCRRGDGAQFIIQFRHEGAR